MKPILYRLMKEYKGRAFINFINVDQNRSATDAYQLTGCPTFILFRDGVEVDRRVGAQSEEQLRGLIEAHLE